ncbi:MAG: EAL domain-containing protein [Sulfurisoma sp.]|nr:EAL domain-containing protein [Sulfurisoma sp.]
MKENFILHALGLKARIAIFTVALFVSAIGWLAHDLGKDVRDNFKQVLAAQQLYIVEHIANSLDGAVQLRINSLVDAASMIEPGWMASPDRLHTFLAERGPLHHFFNTGLFVISREGIGLADLPHRVGRDGSRFTEADFFREALMTGKPVVGKPIPGQTGKPIINIAVPIKNGGGKEIVGVLVGGNQISESDFLGETSPQKLDMSGDVHLMSPRHGMFVTSTDPSRVMQPDSAADSGMMHDRYKQGHEGSGVAVNSRGIESLSSAKSVRSTGWLVVATLPTAIAFKKIATLEEEIYRDAALASAVIVLLLWLFLHRQLSPISRSAHAADAMASGHAPLLPLPLVGSKEIRRLLGSFNRLQQHIGEQADSLQQCSEQIQLAASVFEGTSEAILISTADNRIISVNRAFCKMTGYDEGDLIGGSPRLLQSGRHDAAFYREMWASLRNTGQWQGEIWNRRKNGEIYPERLTISSLYNEAGEVIRRVAIAADITEQKRAEAVIWQQANHDLLTKLPNRRLLHELMGQALDKSRRDGWFLAVLHVDLDHFKEVNDTLGHDVGDQIIIEAARRISSCVAADADTVAHLGGDEFVVVLGALAESSPRVEQVAGDILRTIAEPFHAGIETVHISASIGITLSSGDPADVAGLLKNADRAKHVAKSQGRNRYDYFTASMQLAVQTRMNLANDLRGALAANQFEVHYQPIMELATGNIAKAEALLRWNHPERGMVSPADFIPIAEETGLIGEIGDWVFREAAQMAKRWCGHCPFSVNGVCARTGANDAGEASCLYQISVNKSPRQFFTGNTDVTWGDYLRENKVSPSCVVIEITEGLLLDRHPEVLGKFNTFRDAGVQIALDDFGTGYSAMSYLKKFDIDYLKIDRSFVRDIVTDTSDRAIVDAIIAMAHKLGLKVVAEGVETIEQRDLLAAAGCDYAQGYLFSKPMPAAQFEHLIATATDRTSRG